MRSLLPFLFLSFGSFLSGGVLEVVSVEAPDTVVIDRDFDPQKFWVAIKFLYRYHGDPVHAVSLNHCPEGKIEFLDAAGQILPVADDYILDNGCGDEDVPKSPMWCEGMAWLEDIEVFREGLEKRFQTSVIDPDLLKHTDVLRAIREGRLHRIRIELTTAEIEWEDQQYLRSAGKKGKHGAFRVDLRRKLTIGVTYEK
jgi:hypothetical protein